MSTCTRVTGPPARRRTSTAQTRGGNEFPIQVGLNQLLSSTPSFNPVAGAGLNITVPELALAIIVAILPVLVLFLFSQRTLVSGMLAGATKD